MNIIEERFIKLTEHIYILTLPTNIGILALPADDGTTSIYVIDSGNIDSHGQMIHEAVSSRFQNAEIKAIMNTHYHADHSAGNSYLEDATGCAVWASKGEAAIIENPKIGNSLFWGGTPIHEIQSRYLLAKPSKVTRVFRGEERFTITEDGLEIGVEVISLPGHDFEQIGFALKDTDGKTVFFMGDAISGRNVIKKYWIQYLLNETETKLTLDKISRIKADFYVPGHGDYVTDIEGLCELNMIAILETEEMIVEELKKPKSWEELLKSVADRSGITLGVTQYVLIGGTLHSYLTGLYEEGRITYKIEENRMTWQKVARKQQEL